MEVMTKIDSQSNENIYSLEHDPINTSFGPRSLQIDHHSHLLSRHHEPDSQFHHNGSYHLTQPKNNVIQSAKNRDMEENISGKNKYVDTIHYRAPKLTLPVPNHILETKIFSKVSQNSVVQAQPAVIHFGGFDIEQTSTQVLKLVNVSTEVQRMHIIPPQTKYFTIKYCKNDRLVPGLSLDCKIEFTPDEWRYFYDCVRIHCKGEENLIIPIHAYPVMSTADFPDTLHFDPVPVGQTATQFVSLKCNSPVEFEFQLIIVQSHPAFTVDPLEGIIPANGVIQIAVSFSPTEFNTAHMKLELLVSQFNAKPLYCHVTGHSIPGLTKKIKEKSYLEDKELKNTNSLDPQYLSPIDRARKMKKLKIKKKSTDLPNNETSNKTKIPPNLNSPYAVTQILNQEPGKLNIKDLREAVMNKKSKNAPATKQMKEAIFEMAVRQDVYEERQNQIRWQVKLGEDAVTSQRRAKIMAERELTLQEYKKKRGDPVPQVELDRKDPVKVFRRSQRDFKVTGTHQVAFDTFKNDMWFVRYSALERFRQATRKIILRKRAKDRIKLLKNLTENQRSKSKLNHSSTSSLSKSSLPYMETEEESSELMLNQKRLLKPSRVKGITFPTYTPANIKDDMVHDFCFSNFPDPEPDMVTALDALGFVPYQPSEFKTKTNIPYFDLKVPQQYKLMGYKPYSVIESAFGYIQPGLARPLRAGAEDEIIEAKLPPDFAVDSSDEEQLLELTSKKESLEEPHQELKKSKAVEELVLTPPPGIFWPINYPSLHIFNPTPGLQVFQPPLPYSETDPDYHLCPIPKYPVLDAGNSGKSAVTQKNHLNREDVIKGVMTWKRFASQGLTSLANTPTLSSVWVPRWSDPFTNDLLPVDVPPLQSGLSDIDQQSLITEDQETEIKENILTPEMISAEFNLGVKKPPELKKQKSDEMFPFGNKMPSTNIPISSTGPVPREKREKELDYFIKKKYNTLGSKINARIESLNRLKTDPKLILR